jgi:hypothetical protein
MFAYSLTSGSSPSGFGVVTDRFLCLLGPEATAELASTVYRKLDAEQAVVAEVLDLLSTAPGPVRFAVVELLDPATRSFSIAVLGQVALEIEQASTTRLTGASDAAWISTEARGVNTLSLMLDGDADHGIQLPIRRGVVQTGQLSLDAPAVVAGPKRRASKPRVAATKLTSAKLEATAQSPQEAGWVLTLPDGSEVDVGLPVVIGRRPEADGREVLRVVAPADKREISGTHLELAVRDGVVQARDLNSTNGTVVRGSERAPRLLHSGAVATLAAGDVLDIGEEFSVTLRARQ